MHVPRRDLAVQARMRGTARTRATNKITAAVHGPTA